MNQLGGFLTTAIVIAGFCLASHPAVSQTVRDASSVDRELGQKLYRQGKYSEAESSLKKATKRNRVDSEAWYYLGLVGLRKGKYKDATKAFEAAVKLRPNYVEAQTGVAHSLLLRGKLNEALKESERAVALDPNFIESHFVFGVVSLPLGNRDTALRAAEKAIELNKNFADAYLLKSQALVHFSGDVILQTPEPNRYQDAAAALETYLRLAPSSNDKQLWNDQLASVKFHLAIASTETRRENEIYKGREVTTKVRLITKPEPSYTELARVNSVEGTVVLRAMFAADGQVKHIIVISALPDGLTLQAVRAAKSIKFIPATLDGKPVSMLMQLEYNFNLY